MQRTSGSHAFTLIELLVVISIIAILAGMLMSAFPMIMGVARSMRCQGNLRQIGVAMFSYDNDAEKLPTAVDIGTHWETGWSRLGGWDMSLLSYTDGAIASILACPVAMLDPRITHTKMTKTNYYDSKVYTGNRTYGMVNESHWGYAGIDKVISSSQLGSMSPNAESASVSTAQIGDTSRTLLVADGNVYDNNEDLTYFGCAWGTRLEPTWLGVPHRTKANGVFCDGHVQSVTRIETVTPGITDECRRSGGMWTFISGD